MKGASFLPLITITFSSARLVLAVTVTPVQKVTELLTQLREQIQKEGAAEAAGYDKFACFCKEQADSKVYAIQKSTVKIEELTAANDALNGDITMLNDDVVTRKSDVVSEREEANRTDVVRKDEEATYLVQRANLTEAITAIGSALTAIESSRSDWDKASLLQKAEEAVLSVSLNLASNASDLEPTTKLGFKSNEVIDTLRGLQKTFKLNLKELDEQEAATRHTHNMIEGARAQKIISYEKEIDQKTKISAYKSEVMQENEQLLTEETTAKDADQTFLDELTATCESKAGAWDERSRARAGEITVITEAIAALGSVNYGVNTHLVGLISPKQQQPVPTKAHLATPKRHLVAPAPTLLQLASTGMRAAGVAPRIQAVAKFVDSKAQALRSTALASLATKLQSKTDHFEEVRAIITDLINRLEAEAAAEADQKALCDTNMAAAIEKRDTQSAEMESLSVSIDAHESAIHTLTNEITGLAAEIADLHKAINEMTELRNEEKARNEKSIADAEAGASAIQGAISILTDYYAQQGSALVQRSASSNVQPAADRGGQTVSDLAPETFEGDYAGRQSESKGVIGLLEIIEGDFTRTATTVTAAESSQQSDFETQTASMTSDIDAKETEKQTKEDDKLTKETELIDFKDGLKDATDLHASALTELEKLKASCVDASESWAERNQHRQDEIDALKQALAILEEWKD